MTNMDPPIPKFRDMRLLWYCKVTFFFLFMMPSRHILSKEFDSSAVVLDREDGKVVSEK